MRQSLLIPISILSVNLLVYIIFILSPFFPSGNTYMGVILDTSYHKTPEAKKILRMYVLYTTLALLIGTIMSVLILYFVKDAYDTALVSIPTFIQFFLYLLVFALANKKALAYKKTLNLPTHAHPSFLVDTAFMEQKDKIKVLYKRLLIIPICLAILTAAYSLYRYNDIPGLIPTHFNLFGQVDGWAQKSYLSVLFPSGMHILLIVIFGYSLNSAFSTRGKLSKENLEESKAITLTYLKGMTISILLLVLATTFMMISLVFAMINGTPLNLFYYYGSLLLLVIGLILMYLHTNRYKKRITPMTEKENLVSPEDQDDCWKWGMFYYNPNDPAILVNKRYGLGWTVNFGSIQGKLFIILLCVILIAIFFFSI